MAFQFEKLEVYQKALDWVEVVENLCESLKGKISYSLLDQLSRAALSIPLNIAEGNGRWHLADKRQFFWIARGSVFECVPIIEVMKTREIIQNGVYSTHRETLAELGKMLSGLIKSVENRGCSTKGSIPGTPMP